MTKIFTATIDWAHFWHCMKNPETFPWMDKFYKKPKPTIYVLERNSGLNNVSCVIFSETSQRVFEPGRVIHDRSKEEAAIQNPTHPFAASSP